MKTYQLVIVCITVLLSSPSFAHAGHDHTSMFSGLVHLVWLAPAIIAAGVLYSKVLKKNYQIKSSKSASRNK